MIGIVGKHGFIGSNLSQRFISALDITRLDIGQFREMHFEAIYICAPNARKYQVFSNPVQDFEDAFQIVSEICNIKRIDNLYLFSTIDVFADSRADSEASGKYRDRSYGGNRSYMENSLREFFGDRLTIARLCGLFGPNMVKNILFDFKFQRFDQLAKYNPDSRYQYMDVNHALDIALSVEFNGESVNVVSEPVTVSQIGIPLNFLDFSAPCIDYDVKTGKRESGYFMDLNQSLKDIGTFLNE
jgi:nucleoside-diphosphate-sugar epimerase